MGQTKNKFNSFFSLFKFEMKNKKKNRNKNELHPIQEFKFDGENSSGFDSYSKFIRLISKIIIYKCMLFITLSKESQRERDELI